MNWQIALYNNLTYSIAVILLISTLIYSSTRKYMMIFSIMIIAGLLLTFVVSAPNWIMPVNTLLLTFCFTKPTNNLKDSFHTVKKTFYYCLTVSTLTWCFIVTLSALIMLIAPSWLNSYSYNVFMGTALVLITLVIKSSKNSMLWFKQSRDYGHAIALEIVVLAFFSFILPTYYPAIRGDDARQWGIFMLSFMMVLVIVSLLVKRMNDLEHERHNLAMQMERQKSYAGQIQAQFERMIILRHYYSNLYHSLSPFIRDCDIEGLRTFFEENITPIHQIQVDGIQLSNIKNDLIRNFIDVTIGQVATMDDLTLELDISENLSLPDHMLMDIFEIISNLVDNALRELDGQLFGLLRIRLYESDEQISIQIANTLSKNVDIEQLYNQESINSENGFGLRRVREIVYGHPNIEHLTYKSGRFKGKEILVQQIIIS